MYWIVESNAFPGVNFLLKLNCQILCSWQKTELSFQVYWPKTTKILSDYTIVREFKTIEEFKIWFASEYFIELL